MESRLLSTRTLKKDIYLENIFLFSFIIITTITLLSFSPVQENQITIEDVTLKQISNDEMLLIYPKKGFETNNYKKTRKIAVYENFLIEIKQKGKIIIKNKPIFEISGYIVPLDSSFFKRNYNCDCDTINDETTKFKIDKSEYFVVITHINANGSQTIKKSSLLITEM